MQKSGIQRGSIRLAALASLISLGHPALAQDDAPRSPPAQTANQEATEAQSRAFRAIASGDYEAARQALQEQLALQPSSFVVHYNLACVHARLRETAQAIDHLHRAIELGFIDHRQLTTDPDLQSIRNEPGYIALIENWEAITKARADANLGQVRAIYGDAYIYETDETRRLIYATAYDAESFAIARDELARLADWGIARVFTDLHPAATADSPQDPYVTVILPNRQDFLRWVAMTYGPASRNNFSGIGGAYDHDRKLLVAQDLGGTLRHEFFHVLHWRSASRRGQQHPIWIQEGLCSLVEDYDIINETLTPVPSWRTNTVKRLLNAGRLTPIDELAAIPRDKFAAGGRTMARYAECRAVFLFLHDKGVLGNWYQTYISTFADDPSGIEAMLNTLDTDLRGLNTMYRDWLKALPTVPEPGGKEGRVGLGIDVDPGSGDGPVVTQAVSKTARASGIRPSDVIYAVNGRPTRDVFELVRILGAYQPRETVELSVRRASRHTRISVQLVDIAGQ